VLAEVKGQMLSAENTTDQRASLSNIDDVTARGDATRRDFIGRSFATCINVPTILFVSASVDPCNAIERRRVILLISICSSVQRLYILILVHASLSSLGPLP
jgi:hypothetical protein